MEDEAFNSTLFLKRIIVIKTIMSRLSAIEPPEENIFLTNLKQISFDTHGASFSKVAPSLEGFVFFFFCF